MKLETETKDLVQMDKDHLWHAMHRYNEKDAPMMATEGAGSWFTDTKGDKYLDGVSGLWCLNLGHGRKEIAQAAYEQMINLSYFPLTLSHKPAIELSAKISEHLKGPYTTFLRTADRRRMRQHSRSLVNIILKMETLGNINSFPGIELIMVIRLAH